MEKLMDKLYVRIRREKDIEDLDPIMHKIQAYWGFKEEFRPFIDKCFQSSREGLVVGIKELPLLKEYGFRFLLDCFKIENAHSYYWASEAYLKSLSIEEFIAVLKKELSPQPLNPSLLIRL